MTTYIVTVSLTHRSIRFIIRENDNQGRDISENNHLQQSTYTSCGYESNNIQTIPIIISDTAFCELQNKKNLHTTDNERGSEFI